MSVNQKLENLLNLSLDTTAEERSRSAELETGYNPEEQTWELIVKYSGSLDAARELGAAVEEMRNEYAILTVKESLIPYISALPQIEYIEKPKRLFFAVDQAKTASCVNLLQEAPPYLSGKGVLVAVVDSGIDYFHEAFRKEDGTTRILELWDQPRTGGGQPGGSPEHCAIRGSEWAWNSCGGNCGRRQQRGRSWTDC